MLGASPSLAGWRPVAAAGACLAGNKWRERSQEGEGKEEVCRGGLERRKRVMEDQRGILVMGDVRQQGYFLCVLRLNCLPVFSHRSGLGRGYLKSEGKTNLISYSL